MLGVPQTVLKLPVKWTEVMADKGEGNMNLKMGSMFLSAVASTRMDSLSSLHKQWDVVEP